MKCFALHARQLMRVSLAVGILSCGTAAAIAQDAPAAADPANNGVVVTLNTKSYVKEVIIFAILGGAAIFAVCRSSPRGL
jgi:hypothetical protein